MSEITEQVANRIVAVYGEPFLRYVFALPTGKPIMEALQATSAELVLLLQTVVDRAPHSDSAEIDLNFITLGDFSRFNEDLGGSLANYLRQLSGGNCPDVPTGDDPVVQEIREITSDTWPVLLLTPPKRGPRTFLMSNLSGIFTHPHIVEACKAFMADQQLSKLFPDAPSLEESSSLSDVLEVHASWMLSSGQGGTRQLVSIIDAIIFNAAVLAQLDGYPLTFEGIMDAIPKSVDFFRKLATKQPVDVPAIIGFSGLLLQDGDFLKFGDDEIRSVRPVEKNLLLNEPDRVTSVLATRFAVQLLDASPFKPGEDSDDLFKAWSKYSPRIEEAHRTLQRRVDRVRLSILLASEGGEYLATSEVARYIADPTQTGGIATWRMDQRSPAGYPLKDGQAEEIQRLHALLQEKHPESLDIAMKRILSAVSQRWDATDAFIDAVVVWENAFGTSTETTFRVTGSIAKLLEPGSTEERAKLQRELKKLYETRSRLVHGAKEPKPEEAWSQRERAIAVAVDVLKRLYVERPDLLELSSEQRGAQLLLEG